MITVFNSKNYAQQWFFDKAFALLEAKHKLSEKELKIGRFLSLEGYFAHLDDLVFTDPSYVLIPSDEEPFVIDANTRTISIPASFNKCAGVVGDNMCEIITFTIDRYFDYVDLANANICIQWKVPGDNSNGVKEGISHISLIDRDSIPGKIRFGWPLTNELTKNPGPISFAVRFFMKNKEDTEFVYLFNTLTTSIIIKEGLNIVNPTVEEEDIHTLFGQFIQRSNNPTYPKPAPVYFDDGTIGQNLPDLARIVNNDTLTFTAQALVSDNGHIDYKWYFKSKATPADKNARYAVADTWDANEEYYYKDAVTGEFIRDYPMTAEEFAKKTYFVYEVLEAQEIAADDVRFKIEEVYEPFSSQPAERNGSEQYFRQITRDGLPAYELVTDAELPHDETLYQRFTTLQIMPATEEMGDLAKDVTGLYWVGATNYVGNDRYQIKDEYNPGVVGEIYAANFTAENRSNVCYVPTPQEMIIEKELPQDLFIEKLEDGTLKAVLEFGLSEDPGQPVRTFTWYCNPLSETFDRDEDLVVAEEIGADTHETDTPGWYYVDVESNLNRSTTKMNSKQICRVLNHAKAPQLKQMFYARWTDSAKENPDAYFADERNWTKIYDVSEDPEKWVEMDEDVAEFGDILRLKIVTDLDDAALNREGLLSDDLVYTWHVIEPDGVKELGEQDIELDNNGYLIAPPVDGVDHYKRLGTNEIDVRCKVNNKIYSFFCQVDNHLVNETKTLARDDYKVVFNIW